MIMYKIAIVGSRVVMRLGVREEICELLDSFDSDTTIIITGDAKGVDTIVKREALAKGFTVFVGVPAWDARGVGAGKFRNTGIVELADKVYAFWNEKSRGTYDTITKAKAVGKLVDVYRM